jgi:hypothetical protein
MNRYLFHWVALGLLWMPSVALGAVFERDWQTPGDGLLTFDNVNRREWLDLSETLLGNFPGGTLEEQYQNLLGELSPGGILEGFTHADIDDAIGLGESAGIDTGTLDFPTNNSATRTLIDLLGATASFPGDVEFAEFLLDDNSGSGLHGQFFTNPQSGSNGIAGFVASNALDVVGPLAVLVYRPVPEPSTLVLVLVCCVLVHSSRHRVHGLRLSM